MRTPASFGMVVAALLIGATSCGGDDSTSPAATVEFRSQSGQTVATYIPGDAPPDECNWFSGQFAINPDTTCEEIQAAGAEVLAQFPDHAEDNEAAVQLLVTRVCFGANGDNPMVYQADDLHIPALADALVGPYCPGDRSNIVPDG